MMGEIFDPPKLQGEVFDRFRARGGKVMILGSSPNVVV